MSPPPPSVWGVVNLGSASSCQIISEERLPEGSYLTEEAFSDMAAIAHRLQSQEIPIKLQGNLGAAPPPPFLSMHMNQRSFSSTLDVI